MTVRITAVGDSKGRTLKVDGWLTGDDVTELTRACEGGQGPLILDLADLQFADGRAVSALRKLRVGGATIVGASPYIRLLLGEPATEDQGV
jgi:hypothetical protein